MGNRPPVLAAITSKRLVPGAPNVTPEMVWLVKSVPTLRLSKFMSVVVATRVSPKKLARSKYKIGAAKPCSMIVRNTVRIAKQKAVCFIKISLQKKSNQGGTEKR
jgi:hypothetical protein